MLYGWTVHEYADDYEVYRVTMTFLCNLKKNEYVKLQRGNFPRKVGHVNFCQAHFKVG